MQYLTAASPAARRRPSEPMPRKVLPRRPKALQMSVFRVMLRISDACGVDSVRPRDAIRTTVIANIVRGL